MPLIKSASREAVGENIKREQAAGKPRRQAIAIALDVQRRARKADGGAVDDENTAVRLARALNDHARFTGLPYLKSAFGIQQNADMRAAEKISDAVPRKPDYASGGSVPFYVRSEAHGLEHSGMIHSPVPGRTDRINMNVRQNSYVIPADVVSGIGQGNSMAGGHALSHMFGMAPGGAQMPHPHAVMSLPTRGMMKGRKGFADGGDVAPDAAPVDVVTAGGEFVVPDHKVAELGGGDMSHGHDILDHFVKHVRARTIKQLRRLPGPKKN